MSVHRGRIGLLCAALESGLYEQGTGRLHRKDARTGQEAWCCLGVAGDVAARFGADISRGEWVPWGEDDADVFCEEIDGSDTVLGGTVMAWYGIPDENPLLVTPAGEAIAAVRLNDVRLYTFAEIAAAFRAAFLTEDEVSDDPDTEDEVSDGE